MDVHTGQCRLQPPKIATKLVSRSMTTLHKATFICIISIHGCNLLVKFNSPCWTNTSFSKKCYSKITDYNYENYLLIKLN